MIEIDEYRYFSGRPTALVVTWPDITTDNLEDIFGVKEQLYAQMMSWA